MTHGSLWWAQEAIDQIAAGSPVALVSIVATEGSAPRDAGTRMLVSGQTIRGTVGGGNLEYQLITQARRLLQQDGASALQQDYPLGPLLSQCCGGRVRALLERLDGASLDWLALAARAAENGERCTLEGHVADGRITRRVRAGWHGGLVAAVDLVGAETRPAGLRAPWTSIVERIDPYLPDLYLFGAGHVGMAIAHIARTLPFRLVWVDVRPDMAVEGDASGLICGDPLGAVHAAKPGAYFLVVTHSHDLDYALARAVLARGDSEFCGLIGSATKRARFVSRLAKENVGTAQLVCPIGASAIRSKDPACIAVAVAADLLARLEASRVHSAKAELGVRALMLHKMS